MKSLVLFAYFVAFIMVFAKSEEVKKEIATDGEIKIYKRLIPADVLRGEYRILS